MDKNTGMDPEELERDLETSAAISKAELRIEIAFWKCHDLVDVAAMWATLEKAVGQSARLAIERHGGDYEEIINAVDKTHLFLP